MPEPPEGMLPMYGISPRGPIVDDIADLDSIKRDLEFVVASCEELLDVPDGEEHTTIRRALWEAIVISYNRSFESGRSFAKRRRPIIPKEVVEGLPPDLVSRHEDLLQERDEHIAHRVDQRERGRVLVLLSNPEIARSIEGVMVFSVHHIGTRREDVELVHELAMSLRDIVAGEVELLQDRLVEDARANLDPAYENAQPMG